MAKLQSLSRKRGLNLHRFWKSEQGSLTNLTLASSVVMIVFGGLGIDFMVAEMKRAKAQQTLDRAVLAGAALNQDLSPEGVVNDYFVKSGMGEILADVGAETGLNYRRVWAETDELTNPLVTHNLGINHIDIETNGRAEQVARHTEISLVLDISRSMSLNNRMTNMQAAATEFVNTVIDSSYPNVTSINLVPYTEHVNAGPHLFGRLNTNAMHGYSHCVEFPNWQFGEARLRTSHTFDQMQHYQWNYDGVTNDTSNPVCPADVIVPMSNDGPGLVAAINAMQPRNGTSIFLGMKWGTALLDPSTRPIINGLAGGASGIPSVFGNRPVNHNVDMTSKHIVLMTDGENDDSFRIAPQYYNDVAQELTDTLDLDLDGFVHDISFWANNNFWWYHDNNTHHTLWPDQYYQVYWPNQGDQFTLQNCTAAKNAGITVWTVAFEAPPAGQTLLQQCATSAGHYFEAEGTDIEMVFATIARAIKMVKLTQ